jgi:hypothetical protein
MSTTNHGWLTRNSLRSFPVREGAQVIASNSGWKLDPSLIVDVSIFSDLPGDPLFCIQSVTVTRAICSVVIGNAVDGRSLGFTSFTLGSSLLSAKITPFVDGVSGFVCCGPAMLAENYKMIPTGIHDFGSAAILESRCGISIGNFPIKSIRSAGGAPLYRDVTIETGSSLLIDESAEEGDDGLVTRLTLSLEKPASFLSPCEEPLSICDCPSVPIQTINGISGNEDGIIFIEIQDENGSIYLLDQNTLSFLITGSGIQLCSRTPVPDEYGRLPDASGLYDKDLPPSSDYQNPQDLNFPLPVI